MLFPYSTSFMYFPLSTNVQKEVNQESIYTIVPDVLSFRVTQTRLWPLFSEKVFYHKSDIWFNPHSFWLPKRNLIDVGNFL